MGSEDQATSLSVSAQPVGLFVFLQLTLASRQRFSCIGGILAGAFKGAPSFLIMSLTARE